MTYLAPRQGLFAIIVFTSFCLHCLLMVVSTEHQIEDSRQQKGERIVAQLIDESSMALENKDRVSLGVMANRFANEADVARLQIRDANEQVLVQIGDAPLQQGDLIVGQSKQGEAVIGDVSLTMKQMGKGEIFTMLWPFVLGSALLHGLLWLAYGYIARPTKEQLRELSRDVHEHYRTYYRQADKSTDNGVHSVAQFGDFEAEKTSTEVLQEHDIGKDLTSFIHDSTEDDSNDDKQGEALAAHSSYDSEHEANEQELVTTADDENYINVHIKFVDDNKLLQVVSTDYLYPYLELCTQLLHQAIEETLNQPILHGLKLVNEPEFNKEGVLVEFYSNTEHSNIAVGGTMLAILYKKLNDVIYEKHRELSRLALPIKLGVSQPSTQQAVDYLLDVRASENDILALVSDEAKQAIDRYMGLSKLNNPISVHERDCVFIKEKDEDMKDRLKKMHNKVLMTGN